MDDLVLNVENVTKRFPGVTALKDVNLEVHTGEVHALVGENGAGKSTLLKIIFGALPLDSGHITFKGQEIRLSGPAEAMRLGISFIPQDVVVFNPVSVAENLVAGREPAGRLPYTISWKKTREDAAAVLKRVGLDVPLDMAAGRLSSAQKQLLLIARALSMDCCLLLMDEPTSSLTGHEVEYLFGVISELRQKGLSVVYVSHKLSEVFTIADTVTVLRDGQHIVTAKTSEISKAQVVNSMVGRDLSSEYPAKQSKAGREPVFEVQHATRAGAFSDISLIVGQGEIVGLFGLVGSGRTEFARAVFGRDNLDSGEIRVSGKLVKIDSPPKAMKAGIGLVPEGRKEQGIFGVRSVRENISVCVLDELRSLGLISGRKERELAQRSITQLEVQTPSQEQLVANLSGGNQQKVILGRWLAANSELLILDEPTAGIDVGTKAEIHKLVAQLASEGKSILYISSELPEVLGISDRVIVFHEGQVVGEFDGQTATEQAIMAAIMRKEIGEATGMAVAAAG